VVVVVAFFVVLIGVGVAVVLTAHVYYTVHLIHTINLSITHTHSIT